MHTKYKSCGPHGFRDLCFSHNKSNGDIDPQGVASLDPTGLCCGALIKLMEAIDLQGVWPVLTPGAGFVGLMKVPLDISTY